MALKRTFNITNLVRELAENRIEALEILREALSNAKDHRASRVWIRTSKDARNDVDIIIIDDGEGMDRSRLEAFWGIGDSKKTQANNIGYKGHGTKLFFDCRRLSVASRDTTLAKWTLTHLEMPLEHGGDSIDESELTPSHALSHELRELGLIEGTGTAVLIEKVRSDDKLQLVSRPGIESYCDWFTVLGDVRSGLFERRVDFHRAVVQGGPHIDHLRVHDSDLRPLEVRLRINGEKRYYPIGQGPATRDKEFFKAWPEDVETHKDSPGILALGHRFADTHEGVSGTTRVRNDLSSLRLTSGADWTTDDGISVVARVEGHRRQLQTYLEARWQNKDGLYSFEERFGLWLCKDFIPITQRNDLLRKALDKASASRLKFELNNLRNWQVFVNHQSFRLTANRNDISNKAMIETRVLEVLETVLRSALQNKSFQEWVERLRNATLERWREREVAQMARRLEEMERWISDRTKKDGIDPMAVAGLPVLDEDYSLLLKAPSSEQELFYVYGLLSGRFEMPVHILEYDASEGVDAIGKLRVPELLPGRRSLVRVEFKLEVLPEYPIHHFFDAIDLIICWRVGRVGDIWEESSATLGRLRKRLHPVLSPPTDTHEIAYQQDGKERVIPIIEISSLFPVISSRRPKRG